MCLKCKIDNENNFFESCNSYFLNINNTELIIKKIDKEKENIIKSYLFTIVSKNIKFILNWNKDKNTYFLHDLTNKIYETNIITNPYINYILIGEYLIEFLFINKPTFKSIKESL